MKQFILRHRKNMMIQALNSASILSLFVYAVLRFMYFEFPMDWTEEIVFFFKTVLSSCLLIATATGGTAWMHTVLRKMRRSA